MYVHAIGKSEQLILAAAPAAGAPMLPSQVKAAATRPESEII